MDDLDFSKPAPQKPQKPAAPAAPSIPAPQPVPVFNVGQAMEFFRTAGKAESFAPGATIFAEEEKAGMLSLKRDKMYLLISGEVAMQVQGKTIGTVRVGEVFGEMAAIARAARTATAVATTACTVVGLDDKQFLAALQQKPEFALSMMGVLNARVRATIQRLQASRTLHAGEAKETEVFDRKVLANLVQTLGDKAKTSYVAGKMIMQEGSVGNVMYIVLEGRVIISIKGGVVGRVGTGGVFGEMALVDQSPRTANALAETDCTLLAINREAFLYLVKTSPVFGSSLLAGIAARAKDLADRGK